MREMFVAPLTIATVIVTTAFVNAQCCASKRTLADKSRGAAAKQGAPAILAAAAGVAQCSAAQKVCVVNGKVCVFDGKTCTIDGKSYPVDGKNCTFDGKRCQLTGPKNAATKISTGSLKTLVSARYPMVLLDARSGKWDDGRRIPGAKSLTAAASENQIAAAVPAKDTLVITYCSSVKCPASNKLATKLRSLSYANVLEYSAGIAGWTTAGNDVVPQTKTN